MMPMLVRLVFHEYKYSFTAEKGEQRPTSTTQQINVN